MSYAAQITKSLHGRQIGLRQMSSAQIGSTHPHDLIVGPEAVQRGLTSAPSTGSDMPPFGLIWLGTGSSAVYTLSPPIPGVKVLLVSSGGATVYAKTKNNETIETSRGSTFTTMKFNAYGIAELIGLTTAKFLGLGMLGDSGDSANAPAIGLATST